MGDDILLVEDDPGTASPLTRALEVNGFTVLRVASTDDALGVLAARQVADPSNVRGAFRRVLREAALPLHFTPDGLRHTYASLLLAEGAPTVGSHPLPLVLPIPPLRRGRFPCVASRRGSGSRWRHSDGSQSRCGATSRPW